MTPLHIPRRRFLIGGAAAIAAAACSRSGGPGSTPVPVTEGGSAGKAEIVTASFEHMVGDDRVAFAIFKDRRPLTLKEGVEGEVTVTKPDGAKVGPQPLRSFGIARGVGGDAQTHAGEPDLVFLASFPMDQGGFYEMDVKVDSNGEALDLSHRVGVVGSITPEQAAQLTVRVGEKAISTQTPTARAALGVDPICTRQPPCSMHETSLDDALRRGRPVVLSFGTPAFCTSRMCGPVIDRIEAVKQRSGNKAVFIHAEIYNDTENISPDNTTPPFKAWRLGAEPYTFFIDSKGIVRRRLSGPIAEFEVEEGLAALS